MRQLNRALKVFALIAFVYSCSSDPMKEHYDNWKGVTETLMANSTDFKTCRSQHGKKIAEKYVIYNFNIVKDKATEISVFNDPYKLDQAMHDCIKNSLTRMSFSLKREREFRNGYLLINKSEEKFNYILY
ncbi:MAG: hypothetical protein H6621_08185 [Halobacteriovoraceae bacterium]|nr:hypothetical protein [Halobacteriovoraceae bacterium]